MPTAGEMYIKDGAYRIDLPSQEGVKEYYAFMTPSTGIPAIATVTENSTRIIEYTRFVEYWISQYFGPALPGTPEYEALEALSAYKEFTKN